MAWRNRIKIVQWEEEEFFRIRGKGLSKLVSTTIGASRKQQCSEKQPKCTQPSAIPALHAVMSSPLILEAIQHSETLKKDLSFNDLNHAAMLNLEVTPIERHLTPYYQLAEENNVSSSISAE
jgi:hypothetical protein